MRDLILADGFALLCLELQDFVIYSHQRSDLHVTFVCVCVCVCLLRCHDNILKSVTSIVQKMITFLGGLILADRRIMCLTPGQYMEVNKKLIQNFTIYSIRFGFFHFCTSCLFIMLPN